MTPRKDYYDEGRRDAEYGDGRDLPHDSFLDRLFRDENWARDREDYREGYRDGSRK